MKDILFISNTEETHKEFLTTYLQQADKIIFAVGFLKQSGINNIAEHLKEFCSDKAKASTFFIGTGLGQTDPSALQQLYNIIKKKNQHELILCTPDAGIFHPKIYVFIKNKKAKIVTGSSNLTNHGWEINDEISVITEVSIDSPEYIKLNNYFNNLSKKYFVEEIESLIEKYKNDQNEYLNRYGKPPVFQFRHKEVSLEGIDMYKLKGYYNRYIKSDYFIAPENREKEYKKAKYNLDVLASDIFLTKNQFHNYFGPLVGHKEYKPKLWHSGSIHRATYKTLEYPDSFREIVRNIKQNIYLPVNEAFDNVTHSLKNMKNNKNISGVGYNIMTEIFLSYNPKKFANLNKNPIAVLSLMGKNYSINKGKDYENYVDLLDKIKNELNMDTFLEIDSFFNYIYWNILEE